MPSHFGGKTPKFYGSVTVAERGQVVIPAEARRDLKIKPSTKLIVLSSPDKSGLMFVKAESITELIAHATAMLSNFEQVLKSNTEKGEKP